MDPAVLLDLLYLKLSLEHKPSGKFASSTTAAILRRLKTSDSKAVVWVSSCAKCDNPSLELFARTAIFDPLSIENEPEFLKRFPAKDHADVKSWIAKLAPVKEEHHVVVEEPVLSIPRVVRLRSESRQRLLIA